MKGALSLVWALLSVRNVYPDLDFVKLQNITAQIPLEGLPN